MNDAEFRIGLTHDQSLVLFELLSRWQDQVAFPVDHPSEEQTLLSILGQLEKSLPEPFDPNYSALLESARTRVLGQA